ncbi:Stage II sporulation protein E (SpoIIE) [Nonomuraea coxensis DSM 45129]|uniref:Stage II sporulation protein E (SpoIIE) n=1 Tax=Nonomuraea coxensis DSM 45129 TaxID=1122611 RepID=A0ABX8TYI2_9ACTN|nr:protein phosphatase 2C domain-containing protein [Nonomuraea coxensis]QYC39984.1 Stage II sporulation protein E (SpoIIE) [Nonomuraea coxensis DSM 45129]
MTFFVISILVGCLSVMTVQGRRGKWPPGMPVTRPRLVAVGGTFEGSHGRSSDAYVIQERLIAAADGGAGSGPGQVAAALALAAVIAGRPQHGGTREQDLDEHVQAAHRAVRNAALRNPAMPDLAGTLDVIVLDGGESPRLRFAHVGNGAIWHCPRGGAPAPLTTSHSFEDGPPLRALGRPSALNAEVGAVAVRPGDRVVMMTDGVVRALGVKRVTELLTGSASPVSCLDRLYDELAAVEPKEDATVVIADFVTV